MGGLYIDKPYTIVIGNNFRFANKPDDNIPPDPKSKIVNLKNRQDYPLVLTVDSGG